MYSQGCQRKYSVKKKTRYADLKFYNSKATISEVVITSVL